MQLATVHHYPVAGLLTDEPPEAMEQALRVGWTSWTRQVMTKDYRRVIPITEM
jgi:hypothetical protein